MDKEFRERWAGYNEQSWQQRFVELDKRHDALQESMRKFLLSRGSVKPQLSQDDTQALRQEVEMLRGALETVAEAPFSGWTIAQAMARQALKGAKG